MIEVLLFCSVHTLAHSVADQQKKMLSFIVEDRCMVSLTYVLPRARMCSRGNVINVGVLVCGCTKE